MSDFLRPDGSQASRLFLRCRACKARWTVEISSAELQRLTFAGADLAQYPAGVAGHECEFTAKWAGKASRGRILSSCLSLSRLDWRAPRGGRPETKCGGACRSAKGPQCDCRCRGEFHGAGHGAGR